ncbi:hypothetical protein [Altericroceibacterium xinjiangense]|uniref:hypothetical protein n=1 Tax=Altericroceibacterium xinjiangense TaxID=762261 RepID=UPI000F7D9E57|nr:hypothetical protein [Altericroceibacterium xinjiangense]
MRPAALSAVLFLSASLAACGGSEDQTAFQEGGGQDGADVLPVVRPGEGTLGEGEAIQLGPDFVDLQLGPAITAGAGAVQTAQLTGAVGAAGEVSSYVACPVGVAACDPQEMSGATVYTYVAEVTPAIWTSVFRTANSVSGFTGTVGFDREQAEAALGPDSELAVRCVNGALVWAVNGGQGWSGAPITVYWQSTSPPQTAELAYQLVQGGATVNAAGTIPSGDLDSACE